MVIARKEAITEPSVMAGRKDDKPALAPNV
jgi:hypothetical protein